MSIDRIDRNWFKFTVNIFEEEDKEYSRPPGSCFDENTFVWQTITCEFYPLTQTG